MSRLETSTGTGGGGVCICPCCASSISASVLYTIFSSSDSILSRSRAQTILELQQQQVADAENRATETANRIETDARAERLYLQWARYHHIRCCPFCRVVIEKNGGCNQMYCCACKQGFQWNSAPLLVPCCGYHYGYHNERDACTNWPPIHRCKALPSSEFTTANRAAYYAQYSACALPVFALAFPILVPIAIARSVEAAGHVARRVLNSWREPRRRRLREKHLAAITAAAAEEMEQQRLEMTRCRRTGEHAWVCGWCHQCGALQESA